MPTPGRRILACTTRPVAAAGCIERDGPLYQRHADASRRSHDHENPHSHWDAYDMCEKLVDVEENFQLWRFRHIKTVERVIGFKRGTGGTAGVAFLRKTLEHALFPELIEVRTAIEKK
jgi:tryptophan 2,3-dioxygenase